MPVDDFCRLCNESVRIKGTLSNTKKIFDTNKFGNEKSVYERLAALGLTLSKDNTRSSRICRSCFRLLARLETDFAIFRKWQEAEKDTGTEASTSTAKKEEVGEGEGEEEEEAEEELTCETDGVVRPEKRKMESTPSETPESVKKPCLDPPAPVRTPGRNLFKPTTEMPVRRSVTEVIIHYPSHPGVDRIVCHPNTAGIVENVTKENWRRAANLIVRHKELFEELKENILQGIEDESKTLCNPYKGFMLWRSSADDLKAFSFEELQSDLQRMSPFIFSIFSQITQQSLYTTCAAAAIALRGREPRLSAFAYYVNGILQKAGATKAMFNRLSKLGITTSYMCAIGKQKELASTWEERLQLLKVANEMFLNTQKEDGDADADEDGSAPRAAENTDKNTDAEEATGTST